MQMTRVVRVAVNGASGRMGGVLLDLIEADARFELLHAVVEPDSSQDGKPIRGSQPTGLKHAHDWASCPPLDVIIDFSGPRGLASALEHCLAHGVALVSGTTGLDAAMEARLKQAGSQIPILRAANFSLGVAVLTRLLREASAALPDWDLEIVEAHHGRKEDAPSGTALALGQAAATARRTTLDAAAVYSREGHTGKRRHGSIGFAVVRGGDIVGEHAAMLIGQGERLELVHRATDRAIFASGALQAAYWLSGRDAGRWQIDDVIAEPR
jgi:4-hydroxy-tetrahydrodipicolinate reductase